MRYKLSNNPKIKQAQMDAVGRALSRGSASGSPMMRDLPGKK